MPDTVSAILRLSRDIDELGPKLSALAAKDYCSVTVPQLSPEIEAKVRHVELFIKQSLDWKDLNSWLDHARKVTDEHRRYFRILSEFGYDINDLPKNDCDLNVAEINRLPRGNGQLRIFLTIFGPNSSSRREHIKKLSGFCSSKDDDAIPLHKVRAKIENTAEEIISLWKTLQGRKEALEQFEERWTRMRTAERRAWLHNTFKLHHEPDFAIYLLAPRSSTKPLDKDAFLTPLLNVEDLAHADILPNLLQTRSSLHPMRFLIIDSRFVNLGYWSGALPLLKIQGRISFYYRPRRGRF